MTTVVAVARDGAVAIAADTCTNVYERPIIDGARKILRHPAGDSEVLLAFSGAGALPGVMAATLEVPQPPGPGEDPQPWAHSVAVAVTQAAVTAGIVENGKLEGSVLLGWGGRLWTLTHSMALPHPDGIAALGSGEGPAIGALDALLTFDDRVPMTLAEMVHLAATIGVTRDRYSEAPIQVEVLRPADPQPPQES